MKTEIEDNWKEKERGRGREKEIVGENYQEFARGDFYQCLDEMSE